MANSLVVPADLADYPGAPFSDALVDAAVAAVRGEVGWHVAPSLTETLVVESDGGAHLFLPTLYLTAVTAVRDVTNEDVDPVAVTGWRSHATTRFRAGVLHRPAGWARGVYEVDVTHGHDACPDDLLPALASVIKAAREGGRVSSFSLGDLSRSFRDNDSTSPLAAVGRYKIPWRP